MASSPRLGYGLTEDIGKAGQDMVTRKPGSKAAVVAGDPPRNVAKTRKAPAASKPASVLSEDAMAPPNTSPDPIRSEGAGEEGVSVLRKQDLFSRVAAITGAKKSDVKPIVDATLQILGTALAAGDVLALPPLGKAKVNRQTEREFGDVIIIKLRRPRDGAGRPEGGSDPLAEADE